MRDPTDSYPRAIPLTQEQLRQAYRKVPGMDRFFAALAATRLEMLPEDDREPPVDETEPGIGRVP